MQKMIVYKLVVERCVHLNAITDPITLSYKKAKTEILKKAK